MADFESIKLKYNFKDLTNLNFGKWTVLSFAGTKKGAAIWLCRCDCGRERTLNTRSLTSGNSKSCGCYRTDRGGKEKRREYFQWYNAKNRCTNPKAQNYHRYGGRGIEMCERWLLSFDLFYHDMGKCPQGMTLDRVNNDGNYEPQNCRWATPLSQTRNRSMTIMVMHEGRTMSLADWSDESGIPYDRLHDRYLNGKPLFAPLHQGKRLD